VSERTNQRILLASMCFLLFTVMTSEMLSDWRVSTKKEISRFSTNLNNSRAMSMSAPSAINTDFSTVKFDDETTEWNNTTSQVAKSAMSHRLL